MVWNTRPIWIMIYFDQLTIIFHQCYNSNLIKKCVLIINIMLYIPKIDDYLKVFTDEKVKDFVVKTFGKYFKSTKEKLFLKVNEGKNLRKVVI